MASRNKKTAPSEQHETQANVATHIGHGDFQIEVSSAAPHVVAYLMNYGLNKSLQDAVAGRKGELKAEMVKDAEGADTAERKYSDEEVAVILHDEQKARFDTILNGTIGSRGPGAPRPSKVETVMNQIAVERLRAAAIAKGKKLPKLGSDEFKNLVGKVLEANGEAIKAEAERRMSQPIADDLGDLI